MFTWLLCPLDSRFLKIQFRVWPWTPETWVEFHRCPNRSPVKVLLKPDCLPCCRRERTLTITPLEQWDFVWFACSFKFLCILLFENCIYLFWFESQCDPVRKGRDPTSPSSLPSALKSFGWARWKPGAPKASWGSSLHGRDWTLWGITRCSLDVQQQEARIKSRARTQIRTSQAAASLQGQTSTPNFVHLFVWSYLFIMLQ